MTALKQKISKAARGLRALLSSEADPTRTERTKIRPEDIVWIFGNARTGSTWLAFIMEELEGHTVWREPYVGELFGRLYYNWVGVKHFESKHFILGVRQKKSWLNSMRSFVLSEASARFPEAANGGYLIVKEPNGSLGAPLLMEALPESRMVLLVRDPRDVVASGMDARSKKGWDYERNKRLYLEGRKTSSSEDPDAFAEQRATSYLEGMGKAKEAYDAHGGRKALVRYEELRADTLGTMKRTYSELGIVVDEAELARAVEKHSWENVPEEKKGEGKFRRKAKPGGWREDLTSQQVETVERITAPLLKEFYPSHEAQSEGRL